MQYQAKRATLAARLPHPSLGVSEFLLRMLRIAPFALPASEHANLRAAARPALTCAGHFPERRHTPRCLRHGTFTCCSADRASPKSPPSRCFARSSEAPRANTASTSPHAMITRPSASRGASKSTELFGGLRNPRLHRSCLCLIRTSELRHATIGFYQGTDA